MQTHGPKLSIWTLMACIVMMLTACATSPYSTDNKARSDALLDQQLSKLTAARSDAKPRLFVLAAALHDQSKAFRGDVEATAIKLLQHAPTAHVIKLANPAMGQAHDLPYATRENLARVISVISASMQEQDRALIMLTTHGNAGILAINAGSQAYSPLSSKELQQMLQPLEKYDHGLILSACYSGSFIEPLKSANRWMLTAAAANRSSFGCQFHGTQTYFIDALLKQTIDSKTYLRNWYLQTKLSVTEREKTEKLVPSSDPQIFIPSKYTGPVNLSTLLTFPLLP